MSKKRIKRPQKYVKPKDPTFKEWWAVQSEKTQKNIKIAAIAVVAVIVLAIIFYYGFYDDGSLKIKNDEVVGKQDNWLIAELDGGKNSDYYHIADVEIPEGYQMAAESAGGTLVSPITHHDNDFTFEPVDAASPITNVYVRAVAKSVDDMIESVHETFKGYVGENGNISEVKTIDSPFGQGKGFTYDYAYEAADENGVTTQEFSQCSINYVPTQYKDVCLLVSVNVYPDSAEGYTDEATLAAAATAAFDAVTMIEK